MASKKPSTDPKKTSAVSTSFEIESSKLSPALIKKLEQQVGSGRDQTKIIAKVLEQAGVGAEVAGKAAKKQPKEPFVKIIHVKSIPRP